MANRNRLEKHEGQTGKPQVVDRWARRISVVSLVITSVAFWYLNLMNGKLVFVRPNVYAVSPAENNRGTVIAFPVVVANTGATVHTVEYLTLKVCRKGDGWQHEFIMYSEPNGIPSTRTPIATGFAVPPRSTTKHIIGFHSSRNDLALPTGTYVARLYAWVDGKNAPSETNLQFELRMTPEAVAIAKSGNTFIDYGGYFREWHSSFATQMEALSKHK